MSRLELIREIHALTKNRKKRDILQIQNQLLEKNFESFEKPFFDEWNVPEIRIKKEQWHHFVRLCINFEEIEYMFRRISYLVRRYRNNTDRYFQAKFQTGISELPDRSSELEQLFVFSSEYFRLYKKITNRINFERTNIQSSGIIRGKINWNSTLIKSMTSFPLSFETDKWRKKFHTPENILLIWVAIWLNFQVNRLIRSHFQDPPDYNELKKLKLISTGCKTLLKYFPFYDVVKIAQDDFILNIKSKKIQSLELQVKQRFKDGVIDNVAYKEFLIWFDKMKTFNFPDIEKKDRTTNFLRDAVKNIDEMYEIWIFFELLHHFSKYEYVKLSLNSEPQSFQLTMNFQNVELFYEKSFSENSQYAWAHSHNPDFTVMSDDEIIGVLDAKNYKNPEDTESPKNKILAYMTNLSTGFGGIVWSNKNNVEYSFPRIDSNDSTKYHNNLKLALYSLSPSATMANPELLNDVLSQIFAEITDRLEPATQCPKCEKIAVGNTEIKKLFGFRKIGKVVRPQSWCRECRSL